MRTLSEKYRSALSKSIIDNIVYDIDIEVGLIDNAAIQNAVCSSENKVFDISGNNKNRPITLNDSPVKKQYASLEEGFFRLDDENICFCPEEGEGDYYQGYVSSNTADENGNFSADSQAGFTVAAPDGSVMSMCGISFMFDTLHNDYPEQTVIKITKENGSVLNETLNIDSSLFEYIPEDKNTLRDVKSLEFIFSKMNRGNIRARVARLVLGIIKRYGDNDLNGDFVCEYDLDATGSRLPQQKASFTIKQTDANEYSPDNPNGYYPFVADNQPLSAKLYVKDRAGKLLDTVKLCDMVLSGDVTSDGGTVTFNAVSYLQTANDNYIASGGNDSLYELLCSEIFPAMNLPRTKDGRKRWSVNESINELKNSVVLPEDGLPLKEYVQLIAQAGRCAVFEDGDGIIHIEKLREQTDGEEVPRYGYGKMLGKPKLTRYPPLKEVQVYWYDNGVKSDETEKYTTNMRDGETEVIDNIFVCNNFAKSTAEFVGKELEKQNLYSAEIIGGAELEPFDRIEVQTDYNENSPAILVKQSLKYNGAVNSTVQYFTDN